MEAEELKGEIRALSLQNVQLQRHVKQKQRFLDKQELQLEILEREVGMDLEGVKGLEVHTSACPQCFRHRDIWRGMRAFNVDQQKQCQADSGVERMMLEQPKRELDLTRIKNGRLQIQIDELKKQKKDPLCKVSEIAKLRANIEHGREIMARLEFSARGAAREYYAQIECEKMAGCALKEKVCSLEAYVTMQQEKIIALEKFAKQFSNETRPLPGCDDLVCKLQNISEERDKAWSEAAYWKGLYDEESLNNGDPVCMDEEMSKKPVVSTIGPDDDLTIRLLGQFELVTEPDQLEICENDLYDAFMSSQESHLHEQILDQMFSSCHNGRRMPEKERKRLRSTPNCRSCKNSFSACLRAIGGIMRKKESRKIWLNVRKRSVV